MHIEKEEESLIEVVHETSIDFDPVAVALANQVHPDRITHGLKKLKDDYYYGRITNNNLL